MDCGRQSSREIGRPKQRFFPLGHHLPRTRRSTVSPAQFGYATGVIPCGMVACFWDGQVRNFEVSGPRTGVRPIGNWPCLTSELKEWKRKGAANGLLFFQKGKEGVTTQPHPQSF